ncbi:MAG: DUF2619 domain-containing protein [Bacillota bacterium]|nr:DUF2619 domain-containing protein [Bacillota bacterium]MDW7684241.1 DUF2619 domain-containing protein [Bacillota bacterium]
MLRDNTVLAMAALRMLSGVLEIGAAFLIIRYYRVDMALRINGILAVVGPTLLLVGIFIGVSGLSDRLPLGRLLLIYAGVFLIFWGTRRL